MGNTTENKEFHCPLGDNDCPVHDELAALREEVKELGQLVRTDHLTSLFNVRYYKEMLDHEMERTRRSNQPTTLVILDIDHFKSVNDNHGHVNGDKVLVHIAHILKHTVRRLDIACRYGGEEFAIILPSTPLSIGVKVAERIRESIETTPVSLTEEDSLNVTASIGVGTFSVSDPHSAEAFTESVDSYLYEAKQGGRNRVCYAKEVTGNQIQVTAEEKSALFDLPDSSDQE